MKEMTGRVVSTAMNKTIIVEVMRQKIHPLYKKIMRRSKRYKVHCEKEGVKIGDIVKIKSVRPISKDKHFSII